jgi:hypothetical protein
MHCVHDLSQVEAGVLLLPWPSRPGEQRERVGRSRGQGTAQSEGHTQVQRKARGTAWPAFEVKHPRTQAQDEQF